MLNHLQQIRLKLLLKINSRNGKSNWRLTGNRIADKITKNSRISPQNSLETLTNEKEIPKYINI